MADPPARNVYDEVDEELPQRTIQEGVNPLADRGDLYISALEKDKAVL